MRLYDWLSESPPPAKESAGDATSPMTGDGTRRAPLLQGSAVGEAALPSLEEQEQAARLQMAAEQRQKREALKAEFEAAETEAEWAKAAEAKAAAAAAEEAAAAAAKEAACRALREKAAAEEARRRQHVVVEMAKRGWTNETEAQRAHAAEARRAAAVAARRADDVKKTFAAGGWRIGDRVVAQPTDQSAGRVSNRGAEILRGDAGTVIGPSREKADRRRPVRGRFIVVDFDGKGRIDIDGTAHLATEAGLLWCTACHRRLPKGGFSASQLDNGRKSGERRCSACVQPSFVRDPSLHPSEQAPPSLPPPMVVPMHPPPMFGPPTLGPSILGPPMLGPPIGPPVYGPPMYGPRMMHPPGYMMHAPLPMGYMVPVAPHASQPLPRRDPHYFRPSSPEEVRAARREKEALRAAVPANEKAQEEARLKYLAKIDQEDAAIAEEAARVESAREEARREAEEAAAEATREAEAAAARREAEMQEEMARMRLQLEAEQTARREAEAVTAAAEAVAATAPPQLRFGTFPVEEAVSVPVETAVARGGGVGGRGGGRGRGGRGRGRGAGAPPTAAAAAAAAPPPPSTEKKLCVVCEDGPADYALLMCGHRCLCVDCVKHFEPGGGRDCPLCRQPIERTMRIHDC